MRFGEKHGEVPEEELYRVAARSSSLRAVAKELGIPWSTFVRHLEGDEEDNRRVRKIIGSRTEQEIPEDYLFDGEYYVFDLSFLNEPYRVHREVWEQVCTSYSKTGANMTKAQVATEFNLPRQILAACLERYGFYKASPPYTHEHLRAAEDVEELVDQTLEQRQHRFHTRLQNKELDFLRREVERLWAEKYDRDRLIENVLEGVIQGIRQAGKAKASKAKASKAKVTRPRKPGSGRPWIAHAPVADLHIVKLVWGREDFGSDYDLGESTRRLVEHGEEVARWIQDRQGHCTAAYLTDIGDFIHAHNSQTESGTPLHQDSWDKKVFEEALQTKIRQIEAVRPYVDTVHIHAAPGNHAGYVDWVVTKVLSVHYRDCAEVVVSDNVRPYDHFLIGESLIVLDHSKGVNALSGWKAKASLEVIARTVARDAFFRAKRIYYFVGHLHELQAASHGEHAKLIRLPSFGESDEYETSLRYASEPVAHLFAHDGVSGRILGDEWAYLKTQAGKTKDPEHSPAG
jgi:hypothetical protein